MTIALKENQLSLQQIISEIISNIPVGYRRNPRLPAVSLPLAECVTPSLPDFGSKLSERTATKQKAQTLITSTTGVIAISTAAGGNNQLEPSLYITQAVKTGIFETMTAYNRFLGGLTLWVGQLFPVSETSA